MSNMTAPQPRANVLVAVTLAVGLVFVVAHNHNFAGLFTPAGALAFLAGVAARRAWCIGKNKWLDHAHPEDAPHTERIKTVFLGWVLVLGGILYTGVQAQVTHDSTVGLAKNVARCWAESYQNTKTQIDINAQNDALSRQQLQTQRDYDRDTVNWISRLLEPDDPAIAALQPNDAARQAYSIRISQDYFAQINVLGTRFDDLVAQRAELDKQRAQHPLPERTCGK